MEKYDICIIGAGPAGYKTAKILAKNGKKVCLIEKDENNLGGTCLNEGCIPAKNYLQSSEYIKKSIHFLKQGVNVKIDGFELVKLKKETSLLLDTLRNGLDVSLKNLGIDLIFGEASFISEDEIIINDINQKIKADKFVISTGSSHKEHPLLKIDKEFILSSREVFKLEKIPQSILIIGAGAIGCEFANFFNSIGSKVHLIEFTPNILPLEDDDVSKTLLREFKKQKIKVETDISATSYQIKDSMIEVTLKDKKGEKVNSYDRVLISIGRVPNTKSLNLQQAKIESDDRGFIEVDSSFKTTNDKVYAIGDTIRTPALAHVAYSEASAVADDILYGKKSINSVVPNVVFTTPQVASVGKNEKTLKEEGISYHVEKLFFKSLGMPKIKGDDSGFVKLILNNEKDSILGCSIVGYDATEIINQVAICINANISLKDIKSMIFAHPTMSESFHHLVESI